MTKNIKKASKSNNLQKEKKEKRKRQTFKRIFGRDFNKTYKLPKVSMRMHAQVEDESHLIFDFGKY